MRKIIIEASPQKQRTIKEPVSIKGVGLHTGKKVTMTLKPAAEDSGYVFYRVDLNPVVEVEALASNVFDTKRATILEKNGAKIMTCEHLLAAFVGMEIDNVRIEIDAEEVPILDGSSKSFIEFIEKAGVQEQPSFRKKIVIKEPISWIDEATGSELLAVPSEDYQITVMIDFNSKALSTQNARLKNISDFKEQISKSRTFCFLHELEPLLDNDLIKGGALDNAVVYIDKEMPASTVEKLEKVFTQDITVPSPGGILNNLSLHYPNEAARHKLLDVVGDLALIGYQIKGHVIATKPGHYANTRFAKKIFDEVKKSIKDNTFYIDLSRPPVMGIKEIMSYLPHRSPFLLVDKIIELTATRVIGVKNITFNEAFFQGHFPEEPIMPGVLQIETMAQVGGVLALKTVPDPENYLTYFLKIDEAKFKKQVIPGDVLVCVMELLMPIRRGLCHMKALAYVNGDLVSEAVLTAQILKVKNKVNINN